jgi:predicted glycosyltransferase
LLAINDLKCPLELWISMPVIDPNTFNGKRSAKPSVLIHCQYVYGIGHYVRALELARGLSERFEIFLLNGGERVPNYDLPPKVTCFRLPAIYKHEQGDRLLPVDPSLGLDDCFKARASLIERLVCRLEPDILITEHFPFGLLFETEVMTLIALVKQRNPKARIVSSVRDVIESEEGGQQDTYICSLLNRWYDMVLVHSDHHIVPFALSFPLVEEIKIPVHHTGYVVSSIPPRVPKADPPLLVVSVGGGRLGEELLYAVLDAHRNVADRWRHRLALFSGAFQKDVGNLKDHVESYGHGQVTVHEFDREHYRHMLAAASGVICLAGYNSLLEAVSARLPVLVYQRKFHGKNKEQALRSTLFQRAGLVGLLSPDDLSVGRMTARIMAFAKNPASPDHRIRMDGSTKARKLLEALMTEEF